MSILVGYVIWEDKRREWVGIFEHRSGSLHFKIILDEKHNEDWFSNSICLIQW